MKTKQNKPHQFDNAPATAEMATQEQLDALREQLCPLFCSVSAPSGPCQMKVTLQSAHLPDVSDFLVDGSMPSEV